MSRITGSVSLGRGTTVPVLIHTAGPGPTVVVTGNVHGDETTGLATCLRLDQLLPTMLQRGTVVLYPTLNPAGLRSKSRYYSDGVDLNRCFPGNDRGNPGNRAADAIWHDLLQRRPNIVLDIHADSPDAIPYALIDRGVRLGADRTRLESEAHSLAKATGLLILWEYLDADYLRYDMERSLAGALLNHGIPAVTIEVGPRRMAGRSAVGIATQAVTSVLAAESMVSATGCEPWRGPKLRRAVAPSTHATGSFIPDCEPGSFFKAGDAIGAVYGIDGAVLDRITAPREGCVISWAECGWISGRTAVGTLGLVED